LGTAGNNLSQKRFYAVPERIIFAHKALDCADGMNYCGVVAATEHVTDAGQ
jgi:hypothetical protein